MFATNGEVFENRPQVVTNLTLNLLSYLTSKQTEVIINSVENLPALSWPYLLALTQVQIYVLWAYFIFQETSLPPGL